MFKISKKIIISGAIGNALEMYDFAIWGLFSVYLTQELLPPQSKLTDIFFLFLITYVLRPIGGLFSGILADQLGRKKVFTISILIMGLCTTLVGLIPSYESIGVSSVFLLLFIRLIQVLTVGGEYISSISFLIESCEKSRKGYFGSWAAFGVNAGMLAASLIGFAVLYAMNADFIPKYGWRLVFIISLITMVVGFWIRNSLPESFDFIIENSRKEKREILEIFKETLDIIKNRIVESWVVFTLVWFGVSTTILLFIYAPIHMTTINNLLNYQSFMINSMSLFLLMLLIPIFGIISDKYGRIKMLFLSIFCLVVIIFPYFLYLSTGNFFEVLICHILIGIPSASIFSLTPVLITEIFPLSNRCSSTGLIYSIAVCFGGGITPLLALKLGHNPYGIYSLSLLLLIPGLMSLLLLVVLNFKHHNNVRKLTLISSNS